MKYCEVASNPSHTAIKPNFKLIADILKNVFRSTYQFVVGFIKEKPRHMAGLKYVYGAALVIKHQRHNKH